MLERGADACFFHEHFGDLFETADRRLDAFEGYVSKEARGAEGSCAPDDGHAPLSELLDQLVLACEQPTGCIFQERHPLSLPRLSMSRFHNLMIRARERRQLTARSLLCH